MSHNPTIKKLQELNQEHLLSHKNRPELLLQIEKLDPFIFQRQQLCLATPDVKSSADIEPFTEFSHAGNLQDKERGKELIAKGMMGCLIIAGGQGTRLRFNGPKGMFGVTPIKNKSLFQLLAEKTLAASKQANRQLLLAVMTSPLNHQETVFFFQENQYFGLDPLQITFFSQGTLPFLNEQGNLFLTPSGLLAEGPDGNGSSLKHFYEEGIWQQWFNQGVRYLNTILIDNSLADPFDAELLGYHVRKSEEITLKCTYRSNPEENVGIVVKKDGLVQVVEYAEISSEERFAKNSDGSLRHLCANLSTFCFGMETVKQAALHDESFFPLHKTFKTVPDDPSHQKKGWKFEKFIFDLLPHFRKVGALLFPRAISFAALKNFSGDDSLPTVQEALMHYDQSVIEQITGHPCSVKPIEISPEFYYPTPALLKKWKGKKIQTPGYVDHLDLY